MEIGKLHPETLSDFIFPYKGWEDPAVISGSAIGNDAATIKTDSGFLNVSTDPITGTTAKIGKYLIDVNANDIAASGGDPNWVVLTLLLPPTSTPGQIEEIMEAAHREAEKLKIAIIGGHTERVKNLPAPIVSGTMIGRSDRFLNPSSVDYGDRIILIGAAGIEGTAILAHLFYDHLLNNGCEEPTLQKAKSFTESLPIVEQARISRNFALLMHDPTEGGILGGIGEIARLVGKKVTVDRTAIPVKNATREICNTLDVNPLKLIGSGSLLVITRNEKTSKLLDKLNQFEARVIGSFDPRGEFPSIERDELWRLLEQIDE